MCNRPISSSQASINWELCFTYQMCWPYCICLRCHFQPGWLPLLLGVGLFNMNCDPLCDTPRVGSAKQFKSLSNPKAGMVKKKKIGHPIFPLLNKTCPPCPPWQVSSRIVLKPTSVGSTQHGNPPPGLPHRTDVAILPTVAPKRLQVPLLRQIFVSRLAPHTSKIIISTYIKTITNAVIRV